MTLLHVSADRPWVAEHCTCECRDLNSNITFENLASAWCNGARLVDDLAYIGAQIQLDVAALLEALLERLRDDGGRGRAGDGLREGVRLGGLRVVGGEGPTREEAPDI